MRFWERVATVISVIIAMALTIAFVTLMSWAITVLVLHYVE